MLRRGQPARPHRRPGRGERERGGLGSLGGKRRRGSQTWSCSRLGAGSASPARSANYRRGTKRGLVGGWVTFRGCRKAVNGWGNVGAPARGERPARERDGHASQGCRWTLPSPGITLPARPAEAACRLPVEKGLRSAQNFSPAPGKATPLHADTERTPAGLAFLNCLVNFIAKGRVFVLQKILFCNSGDSPLITGSYLLFKSNRNKMK